MGPTDTWHPGSSPVGARWSVAVPLLPDELLSSWLMRTALAQGCEPLVLTGEVWPGWRIWTLDLDRCRDATHLTALAGVSGIPLDALRRASLADVARAIHGCSPPGRAVWPWILTLGSRNRRRRGGLQYCAACLRDDTRPYYRMQWRFAWHTACGIHGCELRDRCPGCAAALEPNRLSARDRDLGVCARCKADLHDPPARPLLSQRSLLLQRDADRVVLDGVGLWGETVLTASEWFALARYFVSMLRRAGMVSSSALTAMTQTLLGGSDVPPPTATGLALELLEVEERARLLACAWTLMQAGPDGLRLAAAAAGASATTFREPTRTLPPCIEVVAAGLPAGAVVHGKHQGVPSGRPRSPLAVRRMWARFRRKHGLRAP